MDRTTALLALTAVALTQNCTADEALEVADRVLGDRETVTEADVPALVREAHSQGWDATWGEHGEHVG